MLKILQYDKIKKYKLYIPFDIKNSSIMYFEENLIHKILYYVPNNLDDNLRYLDEVKLNTLIELVNLIYEKEKLRGYSLIKCNEYKSLNKNKGRDLRLKLEDCYKIIDAFDILTKNNIKYIDFHCGNVLLNTKTNDVKICDVDGISIEDKKKFEHEQLESSVILCLMYLYNLRYSEIQILLKNEISINKNVNDCLKSLDTKFDFYSVLDKLNLQMIQEEKNTLKKKIIYLKDTGYYNMYY